MALVVAVRALRGQQRVVDTYRRFSRNSDEDVLALLDRYTGEVADLRGDVVRLREYADSLRELISVGFSRVGTVRYDAFDDMGGRMSYSTVLTDEHGDGVVLTAINGRVETRSYAKPLRSWGSEHNLSAEEREAVGRARSGVSRGERVRPPGGNDRSGAAGLGAGRPGESGRVVASGSSRS